MIKEKMNSCAFTGHRPKSLPWGYSESDPRCVQLKKKLKEAIIKLIEIDICTYYNGLAEGFDMYAAEVLLELKHEGYPIYLIGCIPCGNQADFYKAENKILYEKIKESCDELYYVTEGRYFNGCMHLRNKYMVDNCSILLAYCKSDKGGTASTVKYAQKQGLDIINI